MIINEILYRRELKRVMGHGVPKYIAQEIVQSVMEVVKNTENIQKYIDYAIDLKFGLGLSHMKKVKKY